MMTIKYQYFHTQCPVFKLNDVLNELGQEGWRLHTCEPFILTDQEGQMQTVFEVVMDRAYQEAAEPPGDEIEQPEAMACRG